MPPNPLSRESYLDAIVSYGQILLAPEDPMCEPSRDDRARWVSRMVAFGQRLRAPDALAAALAPSEVEPVDPARPIACERLCREGRFAQHGVATLRLRRRALRTP